MTTHLKSLARRLGVVMVLPLLLGSALVVSAPSTPSAEAAAYVPPTAAQTAAYEARVIYQINVQRVQNGRSRLAVSNCADRYAEAWASHLTRTWTFYHQPMAPLLRPCQANLVGENLARGGVNADRIVVMWMGSSGHRANILNPRFTRIGLGAVHARGQWTVVADFTS
jgi:uncharacterized protein YkwD